MDPGRRIGRVTARLSPKNGASFFRNRFGETIFHLDEAVVQKLFLLCVGHGSPKLHAYISIQQQAVKDVTPERS
jgi:hypothetical protein